MWSRFGAIEDTYSAENKYSLASILIGTKNLKIAVNVV